MKLNFKLLNQHAIVPTYATDGSGAFDFYVPKNQPTHVLEDTLILNLGIAFEVPPGHVLFITGRSGMAFKHDVRLANCLGVIDSDYRDSVAVKLTRDLFDSESTYLAIYPGDRIAQGFILPVPKVEFVQVEELSTTDRSGGFGSTGGFGEHFNG